MNTHSAEDNDIDFLGVNIHYVVDGGFLARGVMALAALVPGVLALGVRVVVVIAGHRH